MNSAAQTTRTLLAIDAAIDNPGIIAGWADGGVVHQADAVSVVVVDWHHIEALVRVSQGGNVPKDVA